MILIGDGTIDRLNGTIVNWLNVLFCFKFQIVTRD